MEQQAKERLTGGVILVVLLVLLVPELLTGPRSAPPAPAAQPDQAPIRSYTMELSATPHAREPVAASTTAPATSSGAEAPRAREPITVSPAASAPVAASREPSAPTPTPVTPAQPAAAAPTVPTRPAAKAAPAHVTEHSSAAWTVQVGTFSNRENASRVMASLKSHGFSPALSEATRNGHKLFRVRVGTERDRAGAQKLLGRLRAAGEKGGEIVPR